MAELDVQVSRQSPFYIGYQEMLPLRRNLSHPANAEIAAVRHYLENTHECRHQVLKYFDSGAFSCMFEQDPLLCCDVCACKAVSKLD